MTEGVAGCDLNKQTNVESLPPSAPPLLLLVGLLPRLRFPFSPFSSSFPDSSAEVAPRSVAGDAGCA